MEQHMTLVKVVIVVTVLIASALVGLIAPQIVHAEGPLPDAQPWMGAALHCTGLGSVANVRASFKDFQDDYAARHNLDTGEKWQSTYDDVVSEFVRAHGCASGGIRDGALTFDFKVYAPVYSRYLRAIPE
jgi:hypothetical protein